MLALGIAVDMPSKGRPALRAVLLKDPLPATSVPKLSDVSLVEVFEVPTVVDDLATQLADLSQAVTGRVQSLKPDLIVVRRADQPPRATNQEGPRYRLLATGAVTAAARLLVPGTSLRTGKECALAYGNKKEALDADARTLVAKNQHIEAAAAALTGLVADRP